jgi:hypothetical protein
MATLSMVERDQNGELKVSRAANKEDLLNYHPRCTSCGKAKGIHGREGETMIFCQWVNRPIEKNGYCSNHTELNP